MHHKSVLSALALLSAGLSQTAATPLPAETGASGQHERRVVRLDLPNRQEQRRGLSRHAPFDFRKAEADRARVSQKIRKAKTHMTRKGVALSPTSANKKRSIAAREPYDIRSKVSHLDKRASSVGTVSLTD